MGGVLKYLGLFTSSGSSKIDADLNTTGDGNRCNFFDLAGCAFQVDISLVHSHLPVIPSLGTLTAGSSSATNTEMFVR